MVIDAAAIVDFFNPIPKLNTRMGGGKEAFIWRGAPVERGFFHFQVHGSFFGSLGKSFPACTALTTGVERLAQSGKELRTRIRTTIAERRFSLVLAEQGQDIEHG